MRRRQTILYILTAIVLGMVVWIVFSFFPSSQVNTVPVVLPTAPADEGDDEKDKPQDISELEVSISVDNVQIALETVARADNYSRILTVESFWSGGSSSQTIDVAARSGNVKMIISRPDDTLIKYILIADGEKWIWYSDSETVYRGAAAENEADRWQTLLSYEDILTLDKGNILEATFDEYAGEMCIYVRYISGEFDYENRAWIDVDSGLLMAQETYDGDGLIYRMSSTAPDLSTPDESIFAKPEA